jgi:carbon-monoxide dehydrogenase medium subunit
VVLASEADLEVASGSRRRMIAASDFFVDLLQTALQPGELLVAVHAAATAETVAYVKTEQKASGFALCGVAAVVNASAKRVRVAVTGVAASAYRARAVEQALEGRDLTAAAIDDAARAAAEGADPLGDIHASPQFRAHLARVNTARALRAAAHLT